jgi:prefoldin subunit 5
MLKHTLDQLEKKIKESRNIPEDKKQEYYELLSRLNNEINGLAQTDLQKAESIKKFTKASAHEATRDELDPNLIEASIQGLRQSVREFRTSHPRLVDTVNEISVFLSKLGI